MKTKKLNKLKKNNTKKNKNDGITLVKYYNFEKPTHYTSDELIKTNNEIKKQFIKTLITPYSNITYLPNNNFYNYINYSWLAKTNLAENQLYLTQIDNYRLIQDNVYTQLTDIILDYIKNNNNNLSKQINNFYLSTKNFNPINSSKKIVKETTYLIDELRKDKNNLWKILALVNKNHITSNFAPFKWTLQPDKKEPGIFRVYLIPFKFSLFMLTHLYGNKDDANVQYQTKHRDIYLKEIFRNILGPNNTINIDNITKVEKKLHDASICDTEGNNEYNRVTGKEAMEKYNFNWDEFTKETGFKTPPDFFIINNLNYLKCATKLLLDEWNSEEWRPFWLLLFYRVITRFTRKWRLTYFNYYGKIQKGVKGDWLMNNSLRATLFLSYPFGHFLSNSYVLKYTNHKNIEFVKQLAEDLKIVFINILKRNTWMTNKTKKYAIYKIQNLHFHVGEKNDSRAINNFRDPILKYSPNEFYNNMANVSLWRNNEYIKLEGKPSFEITHLDWSKYPVEISGACSYVVNAFYYPVKNSIYIPLGYIQSPFVDLHEKGLEYNLANVGFTIAHELSHALDNIGGKYNVNGELEDWWSETDKKHYFSLQKDVLDQYNKFAAKDGLKYNPELTLSEDLADISGLAICEEYLRDYQSKNELIAPVKYLAFREFYVYFAYQMRQIIPKSALQSQLLLNPHPPDVYRTNVTLSRSEIFKAIYNVKKGDGMWWHNTNTIW